MYRAVGLGFSLFGGDYKWRYFRLVKQPGIVIARRGPTWMSDDDADDEVMGLMQASMNQGIAAQAQRLDYVNGHWTPA